MSQSQKGKEAFHQALYTLSTSVDPAYTFIFYQFNRTGLDHGTLDAAIFVDDGVPCLGINFDNFEKLSPLGRISMIQHCAGHLLSGHLGDRLGHQLRTYCEAKYGKMVGSMVYYLTIETAADSFVGFPGALRSDKRPFYDVRKLGLERFAPTLNILQKVEENIPPGLDDNAIMKALQELAEQLMEDTGDSWDDFADGDNGGDSGDSEGDDEEGGGSGQGRPKPDDSLKDETGGIPVKDIIDISDKSNAMVTEDKVRQIIKNARDSTKDSARKYRGFGAADCVEFIAAEEAQPKVSWYERMNAAVSSKLSEERRVSKLRLNRRVSYYQGRTYENTTVVTFIIDTSGSMREAELTRVNAEVNAIAQNTDSVTVIHSDKNVAKCEEYQRGMTLDKFFGRGGTTFKPAFQYIHDNCSRDDWPTIVVYFTDGYGERLAECDDPVITQFADSLVWVLTPDGMDEDQFRDHIGNDLGEIIKIEEWD